MADLSARDRKIVRYLNEAYGKEKELETTLQAHIGMTSRAPYKKRLQQHLTETKRHAREIERRIKQLGESAQVAPIEESGTAAKAAGAAVGLGSRAMAAMQGPLHAIRGTGEEERMLKNAKSEYTSEHEEIALYTALETLAEVVSDRETERLARSIRREEEAMARFLARLIPTLTKAVATAEIPAAERPTRRRVARRRRGAVSRPAARGSRARSRRTSQVSRPSAQQTQ